MWRKVVTKWPVTDASPQIDEAIHAVGRATARVAIPSSGIGKFAILCLSSYSSSYRAFSIAHPRIKRPASLESVEWWSVEWER